MDRIRTERLAAKRLRATDFADLRRLHQDPRVMATLSADGIPFSEEETRQHLHWGLDHWDRHGFGIWIFRDRATGRFVGYCGLYRVKVEGSDTVELLYAIVPESWGQGLATEMAGAVLTLGRERHGITDVVCFTLPANRASQRVMEKNGFRYERDIVHAGLPHVLYRRAGRGSTPAPAANHTGSRG